VSKTVLIDITRLDNQRVVIADFMIGDETGIIKMRLRNGILISLRLRNLYWFNKRRSNNYSKKLQNSGC